MVSIVMPRARRNCNRTLGRSSRAAQQGQSGGARNNQPNLSQRTNQDFDLSANGTSINLLRVGSSAITLWGDRQSFRSWRFLEVL